MKKSPFFTALFKSGEAENIGATCTLVREVTLTTGVPFMGGSQNLYTLYGDHKILGPLDRGITKCCGQLWV